MTEITDPSADGELRPIPVADITAEEGFNPRSSFDRRELEALAASVAQHGVLTPITVGPHNGSGYRLIAGERRLRAARDSGLAEIPAVVRYVDDHTAGLDLALLENIAREDLTPLDVDHARFLRAIRLPLDCQKASSSGFQSSIQRPRLDCAFGLWKAGGGASSRSSLLPSEIRSVTLNAGHGLDAGHQFLHRRDEGVDALAQQLVGDVGHVDAGVGERVQHGSRVLADGLAAELEPLGAGPQRRHRHRVDRVRPDEPVDVHRLGVGGVFDAGRGPQRALHGGTRRAQRLEAPAAEDLLEAAVGGACVGERGRPAQLTLASRSRRAAEAPAN